jgi:transketolase
MKLYYYPKETLEAITDEKEILNALRVNILYMIQRAGHGHIGSAFSALPIMWDIYSKMQPQDIFFSSKGHDCAALYAILIYKGIIPFDEIHKFRQEGGLPGHPHPSWSGIHFHTGSLGMGLSKAQGLALADRLAGRERKIHVLVGDGELQEGQISEAVRNISKHGLWDRITVHVDENRYQCDDVKIEYFPFLYCAEDASIELYKTTKGYGDDPLHAGALNEKLYQKIVGELIHDMPYQPTMIEYERPTKPYWANELISPYKELIYRCMIDNDKILILNADLAKDCGIAEFRQYERFIEFGISEQDMVSAASGLAYGGYLPIVHSFAAFLCRRANEQIYNNCCEGRKIVYIGVFSGILPCGPGETHECIEDVALMKTMPNMNVFSPHNAQELRACFYYAIYETTKSSYIRIPCLSEIENARR